MATTKQLLQHPTHDHPLEPLDLNAVISSRCCLCGWKIRTTDAYTCPKRECEACYYHKVCAEAPPQIDRHPLHPAHPLHLIHDRRTFVCDACGEDFDSGGTSFMCRECDFNLNICCAFSTLSDEGRFQGGKTSEQITIPLHPHTLTSFFSRHDFVEDSDCYICKTSVEGDGYMCLRPSCEFIIHKGCIQDLYYADGTKAPRVYHDHPLEIFVGEDAGSRICDICESEKSGEFIGCASCEVFYHRHCFQVPEILQYPSHNPDHTLVLFPDTCFTQECQSCTRSLVNEIYYSCTSCEFFVHVGCVSQVLTYYEEGMSGQIQLSWHKHPLLLCHRTKSTRNDCFYCMDKVIGPTYMCKDCGFLVHKPCMETVSVITHHPHHPDHPLTLCKKERPESLGFCKVCGGYHRSGLKFSCNRCLVDLHIKCAARFPTHKHYLHEHKLVCVKDVGYLECNRCKTKKDSTVFRCVPCNFNLHEECMELPKVMRNDKIHWHPLTLHETFLEDNSGKYYCEHCENTRDPKLGVYVCGECKISIPRIYHIHCVLPELRKIYTKKSQLKILSEQIERKTEVVHAIEEKLGAIEENLKEAKEDLDELVNQRKELLKKDSEIESCI